jgi:hypothetical protein
MIFSGGQHGAGGGQGSVTAVMAFSKLSAAAVLAPMSEKGAGQRGGDDRDRMLTGLELPQRY